MTNCEESAEKDLLCEAYEDSEVIFGTSICTSCKRPLSQQRIHGSDSGRLQLLHMLVPKDTPHYLRKLRTRGPSRHFPRNLSGLLSTKSLFSLISTSESAPVA